MLPHKDVQNYKKKKTCANFGAKINQKSAFCDNLPNLHTFSLPHITPFACDGSVWLPYIRQPAAVAAIRHRLSAAIRPLPRLHRPAYPD